MQKKDTEKFFFHMNIFDDDHVEEEEEPPPPPPPTFSEEELAAAKEAAFAAGKKEGFDEATTKEKNSREAFVAATLERISADTSILFEQEQLRAELYEREATALCLSVFKKILPTYQEKFGFEELKENISSILQKQQNQREISIDVHPENVTGVEALLAELTNKGFKVKFSVQGDENLDEGACSMRWHNGGANLNPEILAEEIKSLMQQTLAGSPAKGHDRDSDDQSSQDIEASDVENTQSEDIKEPLAPTSDEKSAEAIVEKPDE